MNAGQNGFTLNIPEMPKLEDLPHDEQIRILLERATNIQDDIADDVHAIRCYLEELMPVVRGLMNSKLAGFAVKKGMK